MFLYQDHRDKVTEILMAATKNYFHQDIEMQRQIRQIGQIRIYYIYIYINVYIYTPLKKLDYRKIRLAGGSVAIQTWPFWQFGEIRSPS